LSENVSYNDDGSVFRKWASENKGVITNDDKFEQYVFPATTDFDYSNFER
jgi:hypothetical protein